MDSWHDDVEDDDDDTGVEEGFGGKDAIIFLIDVASPDMHEHEGDEDTPFQKSLKCVFATLRRKVQFF